MGEGKISGSNGASQTSTSIVQNKVAEPALSAVQKGVDARSEAPFAAPDIFVADPSVQSPRDRSPTERILQRFDFGQLSPDEALTASLVRQKQALEHAPPPDRVTFEVTDDLLGTIRQKRRELVGSAELLGQTGKIDQENKTEEQLQASKDSVQFFVDLLRPDGGQSVVSDRRREMYDEVLEELRGVHGADQKYEVVALKTGTAQNGDVSHVKPFSDVVIKVTDPTDPEKQALYIAVSDDGKANAGLSSLPVGRGDELVSAEIPQCGFSGPAGPLNVTVDVSGAGLNKVGAFLTKNYADVFAAEYSPYLHRNGDPNKADEPHVFVKGERGAELRNFIGGSLMEAPTNAPALKPGETLEEYGEQFERIKNQVNVYEGLERINKVAEQIEKIGGANAQVTTLPVVHVDRETGATTMHPLYRVLNPATQQYEFVDTVARRYSGSMEEPANKKWMTDNMLPPGKIVFPKGGHLLSDGKGSVDLEIIDSPSSPEKDKLLAAGAFASMGLLFVPGANITAIAYMAGASAMPVIDALTHGQTPTASQTFVAAAGAAGFGQMATAMAGLTRIAGAANKVTAGLGLAASVAVARDTALNWQNMSDTEKLVAVATQGFFGALTGVQLKQVFGAKTKPGLQANNGAEPKSPRNPVVSDRSNVASDVRPYSSDETTTLAKSFKAAKNQIEKNPQGKPAEFSTPRGGIASVTKGGALQVKLLDGQGLGSAIDEASRIANALNKAVTIVDDVVGLGSRLVVPPHGTPMFIPSESPNPSELTRFFLRNAQSPDAKRHFFGGTSGLGDEAQRAVQSASNEATQLWKYFDDLNLNLSDREVQRLIDTGLLSALVRARVKDPSLWKQAATEAADINPSTTRSHLNDANLAGSLPPGRVQDSLVEALHFKWQDLDLSPADIDVLTDTGLMHALNSYRVSDRKIWDEALGVAYEMKKKGALPGSSDELISVLQDGAQGNKHPHRYSRVVAAIMPKAAGGEIVPAPVVAQTKRLELDNDLTFEHSQFHPSADRVGDITPIPGFTVYARPKGPKGSDGTVQYFVSSDGRVMKELPSVDGGVVSSSASTPVQPRMPAGMPPPGGSPSIADLNKTVRAFFNEHLRIKKEIDDFILIGKPSDEAIDAKISTMAPEIRKLISNGSALHPQLEDRMFMRSRVEVEMWTGYWAKHLERATRANPPKTTVAPSSGAQTSPAAGTPVNGSGARPLTPTQQWWTQFKAAQKSGDESVVRQLIQQASKQQRPPGFQLAALADAAADPTLSEALRKAAMTTLMQHADQARDYVRNDLIRYVFKNSLVHGRDMATIHQVFERVPPTSPELQLQFIDTVTVVWPPLSPAVAALQVKDVKVLDALHGLRRQAEKPGFVDTYQLRPALETAIKNAAPSTRPQTIPNE